MKLFSEIIKQQPSVGDVHVAAALGGEQKKRKWKPFSAFVSGTNKPEVVLPTTTSVNKKSYFMVGDDLK